MYKQDFYVHLIQDRGIDLLINLSIIKLIILIY